jgi:hypothetical protein
MRAETIPVIAVFSTISWVAWLLFSSIRRYKIAQLQADIQGRLLQRFDSPDGLLGYVQSDAGRQLIKSMDIERSTPYSQILKGVQAGIVFVFFGAGMLRLHAWNIGDEGPLYFYPHQQSWPFSFFVCLYSLISHHNPQLISLRC